MWKPIIEIAILWFAIYQILIFFEGTRAIQVLRGITVLLIVYFLVLGLKLEIIEWILAKLFAISVIGILIIFHPEIRQGLARLGQRKLINSDLKQETLDAVLKQVSKAVDNLSRNKIGALIVIEKNDPLNAYVQTGVFVDANLTAEMIENIFTPNSLLHDGGLIIQHERIMAAGCLFPLTQKQDLSRIFGTRHRAALGLSEETDAVIIIVSEERQDISLVYRSKLYKDLSKEELFSKVKDIYKS